MLTHLENITALADSPGRWIDQVHNRRPPKMITLDMDSSKSPVHGDLERCALRPGNVHSADGWEDVLCPVLTRYAAQARPSITRCYFRGDAAFTIPALFDLPEDENWGYAIRIKGNNKLYEQIPWLLRHGRYAIFQMAETALPRQVFAGISGLIDGLRDPPAATGCT